MNFTTEVKREFEDKIGKNLFTKDLLELAKSASALVHDYETTPPEEYDIALKFISDIVMSLDVLAASSDYSNDAVPILEHMLDNGQDVLTCEEDVDDYIEGMFKAQYGVDMGEVHSMFQLDHSYAYGQFTEVEIHDATYYVLNKGIAVPA